MSPRVVSLVPSLTETLFDLGAGADVVGITDYCIFPPDLRLPRVGGTKNPRVDEIRALRPDGVYMNMEENLRRHADAIAEFARVDVSEPKSVDDVAALIARLGDAHGCADRARALIDDLQAEVRALGDAPRFTFACPIWKNPWMWCGGDTYVARLVETAGGTNVLANRARYPQLELEEVLALRPDVIFLPDEPYLFTPGDAAAIPVKTVGPFPGHLFTWHGTRTIAGLRFLRMFAPGVRT
ncbi:MAG TPA: helical backbone metal receptor [Thermoanaerobaculia bacterium]|nr:helical backbone metal receptor [Thermoanaerobaculia bacterium]